MKKDVILKSFLILLPVAATVIFWTHVDPAMKILLVMLAAAIGIATLKGGWPLIRAGLQQTGRTLNSMWFRILLGMALGGFIQVLVPSTLIADWLGPASGLKGILIGSYAGLFLSGGPYVILPVVAAIYEAGAGAGPIISLLSGGLLSVQGLFAFYIPILGLRLSLTQYLVYLFIPPLLGLAGGAVFHLLGIA